MRVDPDGEFWNYAIGGAVGAIVGIICGGLSSVAGKATTDIIGAAMYSTEFGSWEDYTLAFVFGSATTAVGKFSYIAKTALDVAVF